MPVMRGAAAHMLCPECHEAVGTIMGGGSWKEPAGSATGSGVEVASDEEDPLAAVQPPCFAFCSRQKGQRYSGGDRAHTGRTRLACTYGCRETWKLASRCILRLEFLNDGCATSFCISFGHGSCHDVLSITTLPLNPIAWTILIARLHHGTCSSSIRTTTTRKVQQRCEYCMEAGQKVQHDPPWSGWCSAILLPAACGSRQTCCVCAASPACRSSWPCSAATISVGTSGQHGR